MKENDICPGMGDSNASFKKPPYCGHLDCNRCNYKEICTPKNYNWHSKRLKDFTLEDAIQAEQEGFDCICGNGEIMVFTNDVGYYEEE